MTGDNGRESYDEVSAMKAYAVSQGVPETDISLDYAGFSTYDSCYRARAIFGLKDAILITQRYHLPRTIYTCRHLGVSSDGLAITDFEKYPNLKIPYSIREYGARIKAWLQINIFRPAPKFLGNPEYI